MPLNGSLKRNPKTYFDPASAPPDALAACSKNGPVKGPQESGNYCRSIETPKLIDHEVFRHGFGMVSDFVSSNRAFSLEGVALHNGDAKVTFQNARL